MLPKWNWG